MDYRALARIIAALRVAVGAGFIVLPGRLGASWVGGDAARQKPTKLLLRAVGIRDVALGGAVLQAFENADDNVVDLIRFGAISDAVDAMATLLAYPQLPKRRRFLALAVAGGSAALGFVVADNID